MGLIYGTSIMVVERFVAGRGVTKAFFHRLCRVSWFPLVPPHASLRHVSGSHTAVELGP